VNVSDVISDVDGALQAGRPPRVHGNGFIQLDLNATGTRRLHVWDDDVPRQAVATPIHDHVFDLESLVLCGTLVHEELSLVAHAAGPWHVYRARREEGTQNTTLQRPSLARFDVRTEQRLILLPGSVYRFPAERLHQTEHRGLTATVMQKLNAPASYGEPRVLVPVAEEPDNDFHRDGHDTDALWVLIYAALEAADSWALAPL
jgi:hypothetical protein